MTRTAHHPPAPTSGRTVRLAKASDATQVKGAQQVLPMPRGFDPALASLEEVRTKKMKKIEHPKEFVIPSADTGSLGVLSGDL